MMRHQFTSLADGPPDQPSQHPDLLALIAARICHDLISPLGAIGNGVELLELSESTSGPELALVRESVQQAHARIRLFRIAFGQVRADQTIGAEELRGILRDYETQLRCALDWAPTRNHPKPMVKLGLLTLLCLETVLPYGGQITCLETASGLDMTARSDRPVTMAALWDALGGRGPWPTDLRASHVQFPALAQAANAQGVGLHVALSGEGVAVRITAE